MITIVAGMRVTLACLMPVMMLSYAIIDGLSMPLTVLAGRYVGAQDAGATSADGKWTIVEVECLGACGFATPVLVNDDFLESVTPEQVPEIVRKYR